MTDAGDAYDVGSLGEEAAKLLGAKPTAAWSAGERDAWRRWAPLVTCLPGITRWTVRATSQVVIRLATAASSWNPVIKLGTLFSTPVISADTSLCGRCQVSVENA